MHLLLRLFPHNHNAALMLASMDGGGIQVFTGNLQVIIRNLHRQKIFPKLIRSGPWETLKTGRLMICGFNNTFITRLWLVTCAGITTVTGT
jgi:hypothetical protein